MSNIEVTKYLLVLCSVALTIGVLLHVGIIVYNIKKNGLPFNKHPKRLPKTRGRVKTLKENIAFCTMKKQRIDNMREQHVKLILSASSILLLGIIVFVLARAGKDWSMVVFTPITYVLLSLLFAAMFICMLASIGLVLIGVPIYALWSLLMVDVSVVEDTVFGVLLAVSVTVLSLLWLFGYSEYVNFRKTKYEKSLEKLKKVK